MKICRSLWCTNPKCTRIPFPGETHFSVSDSLLQEAELNLRNDKAFWKGLSAATIQGCERWDIMKAVLRDRWMVGVGSQS
ncbi:hypothetical protein E2C01_085350 [Portunus trituberculatus]|uniref:Uncharacterized protein n=1 Tax=Portunus trituberculatus TaxID=210409 RepID=A0A5B7J6J0_PORTR|nr:hypothetical protein [Portunus trituberculatus]